MSSFVSVWYWLWFFRLCRIMMGVICPSVISCLLRLRSFSRSGVGRSYVWWGYWLPSGTVSIWLGGGQEAIRAWPEKKDSFSTSLWEVRQRYSVWSRHGASSVRIKSIPSWGSFSKIPGYGDTASIWSTLLEKSRAPWVVGLVWKRLLGKGVYCDPFCSPALGGLNGELRLDGGVVTNTGWEG